MAGGIPAQFGAVVTKSLAQALHFLSNVASTVCVEKSFVQLSNRKLLSHLAGQTKQPRVQNCTAAAAKSVHLNLNKGGLILVQDGEAYIKAISEYRRIPTLVAASRKAQRPITQ